ncbi:sugar ABC transporter substrate-binding protein [Acidipropionibacterium jensenii]|uniref:Sugar ABC transporter substrate-binding protein n=1 Tax=Acidipropionibacterium jensenii TaxID=1749 RepID=A0A3Q9UH42_9ACTN|nr:substrate-binding domain-containing protein [Acidipropionibacterium jensenii]AZZ38620.1 sugar ABC transporter substrate-binding protein [Acidipropionibacterium jensenii]
MKRRTFLAGAASLAATGALSACGGFGGSSGGDDGGKTQLTLFHRWPNEPNKSYFTKLVKDFEAKYPNIAVKVDAVLNDTYKDKVRVTVGSANAPDVFFSFSGSFASSLVDTGNVMDLTDFTKTLSPTIIANQLEPFQVDGKQMGLPITMNGKVFFYNKKIFNQHGIQTPTTWEELLQACKTLKSAGVTPISYGSKEGWTVAHYVGTLNQRVLPAATILADADPKKGKFTDPGYVTALNFFKELFPYMTANPNAVDHQHARDAWLAGKTAMAYLETSEWSYITDKSFQWGTFDFPSVPDGKGDQKGLTGAPEGFMISAKTKHADEAKKFLGFMLSLDESVAWTNRSGYLSPVTGAVDKSNAPTGVKALGHEIAQASQMTPWLDDFLDQRLVSTYLAQGQSFIGGKITAEQVMAAVQKTAAQVRAS